MESNKVHSFSTPTVSINTSPLLLPQNSPPHSPKENFTALSPINSPNNSPRIINAQNVNNNNANTNKEYIPIIEPFNSTELETIKLQKINNFGESLVSIIASEKEALSTSATHREDHLIPINVVQVIEFLRCFGGLKEPGLFRICGKHAELVIIQKQVEEGFCLTFEDLQNFNLHTLGDLLKHFLRKLSHPIIPYEYTYYFLVTSCLDDKSVIEKYLSSLLKMLPKQNFNLLKYLCQFFKELIEHASSNMMGSSNLSIIFAPLIFGQSLLQNSKDILIETQATSKVAQYLIDYFPTIYTSPQPQAEILVVYENYSGDGLNFYQEDEVIVYEKNEEMYFSQVNGKFLKIPFYVIECMCKAKDPNHRVDQKILEARERTLLKLLEESTTSQSLPHSSNYIKLTTEVKDENEDKKGKKKRGTERKPPSRTSWYGAITARSTNSLFGLPSAGFSKGSSNVFNFKDRSPQLPFTPRKKAQKKDKGEKKEKEKEKIEDAITEWSGEDLSKIKKLASSERGLEKSLSTSDKLTEKGEKEVKIVEPPSPGPKSPKAIDEKSLHRTASGRRLSF